MYEENSKDATPRKQTILTARRGNMLEKWCPLLSAFISGRRTNFLIHGIGHSYGLGYLIPHIYFPRFFLEFFRQVSDELVIRVIHFICRV